RLARRPAAPRGKSRRSARRVAHQPAQGPATTRVFGDSGKRVAPACRGDSQPVGNRLGEPRTRFPVASRDAWLAPVAQGSLEASSRASRPADRAERPRGETCPAPPEVEPVPPGSRLPILPGKRIGRLAA